ncbi:MAG: 2-oxoacid:ferredoxin oxidoreductase subunit beta [Thermodesulfobacteriota bacterium]|nr:2-oxoacid:ferredoxin oxidoreductase subunit beta [Thermodesulfobacteriota bacterium]
MSELINPLHRFIRPGVTSTTNCPGCGNGIVAQAILRAIDELSMDLDDCVFASGIGCSAWVPSPFFNADVLHTTHGRPIAFALGIKMGLPQKKVMVVSGDGDLAAIGGNHLIHNARRNVEMTVICLNNSIYGMTGGQAAPTTPMGLKTTTTPYGAYENTFDISNLVIAAGASFVARWTTYHPRQLTASIKKAIRKKGFSFIEVITQCPVQYGRKTGSGSAVEMLREYKEKSVSVKEAAKLSEEDLQDRIIVGELIDKEKPEMVEEIMKMKKRASGENS